MWKCLIINNMDNLKNFAELLPSEQTAKGRLTCSVVNHHSLTLTPCSQTKAIVANCRRSKIRPKTYTPSLNTCNAGLQTGKSPGIPASSLSLNTLGSLTPDRRSRPSQLERGQPVRFRARPAFRSAATAVQHHRESLQRVAVCCTVLRPQFFGRRHATLVPV